MTMSGAAALATVDEEQSPQLELFVKLPCPRGRQTLLSVQHVFVAAEHGEGLAFYSYRCPLCGTVHWHEASPELAHLLTALGAQTAMHVASTRTRRDDGGSR